MLTFAANHDLRCIAQELVNWGTTVPIDCLSTLVRLDAAWPVRELARENRSFMREAEDLRRMSVLYGQRGLKHPR